MADDTEPTPRTKADEIVHKYGHRLIEIEPLLKKREFRLVDFDGVDAGISQQLLTKLRDMGGLVIAERERDSSGTRRCRYRWPDGVRERFKEHLDNTDRLPCGHRWHVHNPPDSPPDWLGCKHGDAMHMKQAVRDARGNDA